MAFGRDIARRFLDAAKICSGPIRSGVFRRVLPDSGDRLIHFRPIFQAAVPPDRISIPIGVKFLDRISVEGMMEKRGAMGMKVEDVRKVLKATQMELVRSKLREITQSSISLSEFIRICSEVSSEEQGPELARSLDESAAVIVLGNVVFVRPDQE